MAITPDTKDWTWVLTRPCDECGFDAARVREGEIGEFIRANAREWPSVLARKDVRERPNDHTWSPLEYAAHVRDVYRLFRARLELMLTEDDPTFPNWDQDATAVAERYNEQDPSVVAEQLLAAAGELADAFERVPADAWRRRGYRSDGAEFTISTFARYLVHDPTHHLADVRR